MKQSSISGRQTPKSVRRNVTTAHNNGQSPGWSYGHRGYALLHSIRQLTRSKFATLLTLSVLAITMTLPTLFLLLSDDVQKLPVDTGRGKSLTAYLDPAIADIDGAAIAASIEKQAMVQSVEFVSQQEALATFQAHSEFDEALDVLDTNPLPGAIIVYPVTQEQDATMIELLADQLQSRPEIQRVQFDLQWIERLESVVALARAAVLILATLLLLTTLMVIGNTIRLEMLRRNREMEVTRLLGAPAGFVRRPFIYLGALYGLSGGLLAVIAAIGIQVAVNPQIEALARSYGSRFSLETPSVTHVALVVGSAILLGILGAVSTLAWQLSSSSNRQYNT